MPLRELPVGEPLASPPPELVEEGFETSNKRSIGESAISSCNPTDGVPPANCLLARAFPRLRFDFVSFDFRTHPRFDLLGVL